MGKYRRMESATRVYHIYNRGIDRKEIFEIKKAKYFYIKCIKECLQKYKITLYAYCIMDNHFHLMLEGELSQIALFMMEIQGRYAYTYNTYHHREGRVFQSVYKSKPVLDEAYFWGLLRYIHLNPVKAGYRITLKDYPFCSIHEYLNFRPDKAIISPKAIKMQQKGYPSKQSFLNFHELQDLDLYDDIEEELLTQSKQRDDYILSLLQETYHINTWADIGQDVTCIDKVVLFLHNDCHFTIPKICQLLKISKFKINKILN